MLRSFTNAVLATTLMAASASAEELCSLPSSTLLSASLQYPAYESALREVSKHAIATWYTDRDSEEARTTTTTTIGSACPDDSRLTLVVYGLPHKDCDAGYSTGGSNQNTADYKAFVQQLADAVGDRKALYVLEPDAVGLLANNGCGVAAGYAENVKMALQVLSANVNADIYLDVGYWTLSSASDAADVAATVKTLAQGGRLKGIALNTSNYRSNREISQLCANFQAAYGDNSLHCIADTSRNFQEPSSTEWCNAQFGAIGTPPTADTGFANLDYFVWIKPAGESDGTCDGADRSTDAMQGPDAGQFFKDGFTTLWNNGYFVKEMGLAPIDGSVVVTPAPTTTAPEPITSKPDPVTPAPSTPVETPTETPVESPTKTPEPATPVEEPTETPPPTTPVKTSTNAPEPTATETPKPTTSKPPKKHKDCRVQGDHPAATPGPVVKEEKTPVKTEPSSAIEPAGDGGDYPSAPVRSFDFSDGSVSSSGSNETEADTPAPTKPSAEEETTEVAVRAQALSFSAEALSTSELAMLSPQTTTQEVQGDNNDGQDISVQSGNATGSEGIGGGALAAIVVAAVAVVGVAVVAIRRRGHRDQAHDDVTAKTPVLSFGGVRPTPPGNVANI